MLVSIRCDIVAPDIFLSHILLLGATLSHPILLGATTVAHKGFKIQNGQENPPQKYLAV
jgi:hypothetical protein